MPVLHDVTPGGSRLTEQGIRAVVRQASMLVGNRPPVDAHYDAEDGFVCGDGAIEAYRADCDRLVFDELNRRGWRPGPRFQQLLRNDEFARHDAFGVGAAAFPTDLEFMRSQILLEPRAPLSAEALFPLDTSVPLGARTHAVRRRLGSGEAQVYRGGNEIPRVTGSYVRESWGVVYVVCATETNYFELASQDFANLNEAQQDLADARRFVDERVNRIYWWGDVGSNVYGVLTHPSIPKMIFSTALDGTASVDTVVAALYDFVMKPMVTSVGVFAADTLALSSRLYAFVHAPRFTANSPGQTIAQMLLNTSATLKRIVMAPELSAAGPSGEDCMLLFRSDPESVALVRVQAATQMPVFQTGPFDQMTAIFGATGGVTSLNAGNNLLGIVTTS
jgi:hypothetical protein